MEYETSEAMSAYVGWINIIKTQATTEWLTDSQKLAVNELEQAWIAEKCVVLRGDAGCGKSFIGRLLAGSLGGVYIAGTDVLARPECDGRDVVLDMGSDGAYSRGMRLVIDEMGARRLVVLTRRVPRDLVRTVNLQLSEHDVKQFRHMLSSHGVIEAFCTEPTGVDLGEYLRREAVARAAQLG
jgi:hypothetical protein